MGTSEIPARRVAQPRLRLPSGSFRMKCHPCGEQKGRPESMSASSAASEVGEPQVPRNDRDGQPTKPRRGKRLDFGETGLAGFIIAGVVGVIALGLYASQAPSGTRVFASGLILAAAASASGGLLGFVFGVPRTLTSENEAPTGQPGASITVPASMVRPSTNLEQISDWLTKILVGATLVQLGTIGSGAARLFNAVAPALGGESHSPTFAGGLLVFFSVLGFLAAWLRTRLLLGRLMTKADQALAYLDAATTAEVAGDTREAAALYRTGATVAEAAGDVELAEELRSRASHPSLMANAPTR